MDIKKYLVTIILITGIYFGNNVFAQKCKYEKNEIDGLMEIPIKLTKPELLCRIDNQPIFVKTQCIGTNKYLKIRYYRYQDFIIQEDKEISFVLSTAEEVALQPRMMPKDTLSDDITNVSTMLVYKLTASQYEKLKNNPTTIFKYSISTGFVEKPIKSSKQTIIMNLLRCVE